MNAAATPKIPVGSKTEALDKTFEAQAVGLTGLEQAFILPMTLKISSD